MPPVVEVVFQEVVAGEGGLTAAVAAAGTMTLVPDEKGKGGTLKRKLWRHIHMVMTLFFTWHQYAPRRDTRPEDNIKQRSNGQTM